MPGKSDVYRERAGSEAYGDGGWGGVEMRECIHICVSMVESDRGLLCGIKLAYACVDYTGGLWLTLRRGLCDG